MGCLDYGFRAVISSFFADIFRNNSLNNGLLPVVVSDKFLQNLLALVAKNPATVVRIDLFNQTLTIKDTGETVSFDINPWKKECMIKGLDDIDYLIEIKDLITAYESTANK
jgi:3-isopropylmalate/(R)-2-methylmalate dehydratase small subunit